MLDMRDRPSVFRHIPPTALAQEGAALYHRPMPSQTWVDSLVLEGSRVRLEPLRRDHLADLALVAFDPALWQWTIMGAQDEDGLERWVETAVANADASTERPFATIDRASGRAIGSSRFMTIVPEHKRLEIGWTWVGSAFQRTGANREAKLLRLTRAPFETTRRPRPVEDSGAGLAQRTLSATLWRASARRSRGSCRSHTIMPDGSLRESAYFSVIASEWPAVKSALEASLAR